MEGDIVEGRRRSRIRTFGRAFVTLIVLAYGNLTQAQQKEAGTRVAAPPQPVPVNARVLRGGKIDIPLRIFGRVTQPLQYRIRTAPEHGRLSEPRMLEREVGLVTYEETSGGSVRNDIFTYAVQTSVGVSAPVEVKITIVDIPSLLVFPDVVDFGKVPVSSAALREITIENRGRGVAEGAMVVEEPWKIEAGADYRLEAGEKATFMLIFAPPLERRYSGRIRYSSEPDRMTIVEGGGFAPFTARPEALELKPTAASGVRRASLDLVNHTTQEQTLELILPPRLSGPEGATLPPNGRTSIEITTAEEDVEPFDEEMTVHAGTFSTNVRVRGATVPPLLRMNTQSVVLGESLVAPVEVENVGGAQTRVTVSITAPFRIEGESSFTLPPREKQVVTVALEPPKAGKYRTWLRVTSFETRIEIPVEAEVPEKPRAPPTALRGKGAGGALQTPSAAAAELPVAVSGVPPVSSIDLVEVSPRSALLEWWSPSSQSLRYQISSRQTTPDRQGRPITRWLPFPNVVFDTSNRRVSARLKSLRPNTIYTVRVVSLDQKRVTSAPSQPFQFVTTSSTWFKLTPLRVLLVILCVLVFLIMRRRRGTEDESD